MGFGRWGMKKPKTYLGYVKINNTFSGLLYSRIYGNNIVYTDDNTSNFNIFKVDLNTYNETNTNTYTLTNINSVNTIGQNKAGLEVLQNGSDYHIICISQNTTAASYASFIDNGTTLSRAKDVTLITSTPVRSTFKVNNKLYSVHRLSTTSANNYLYYLNYNFTTYNITSTKIGVTSSITLNSMNNIQWAIADEIANRIFFSYARADNNNLVIVCATYTLTGGVIVSNIIVDFVYEISNTSSALKPFLYDNKVFFVQLNIITVLQYSTSTAVAPSYYATYTIPNPLSLSKTVEEHYRSFGDYINPTTSFTFTTNSEIICISGNLFLTSTASTPSNGICFYQISKNILNNSGSYTIQTSDIPYAINARLLSGGSGVSGYGGGTYRGLQYDEINNVIVGGPFGAYPSSSGTSYAIQVWKINNR